jgi:hypothetical protein
VLAIRTQTAERLSKDLIDLKSVAIDILSKAGFEGRWDWLLAVADDAQRFVDQLGGHADTGTELAADLLSSVAIAVDLLIRSETTVPDADARLVYVGRLFGTYETLLAAQKAGIMDAAATHTVLAELQREAGRRGGDKNKSKAAQWQKSAFIDFQAANTKLSVEEWAKRNARRYGRKPGTVAKAINANLRRQPKA